MIETKINDDFLHLRLCFGTIFCLIDYNKIINENKSQLQYFPNQLLASNKKNSCFLADYFLLEITSLYDHTEKYKTDKGIGFPEPPIYYKDGTLRKFRNKMPGHRDNRWDSKDGWAWMPMADKIDKIGMYNIIEDVMIHIDECSKVIREIGGDSTHVLSQFDPVVYQQILSLHSKSKKVISKV